MATLAKRGTGIYGTTLVVDAGLDALTGAWLFLSAFLFFQAANLMFLNNITCGALVCILSFGVFAHVAFAWLPALIGMWVMISPFALGFGMNSVATANNVITGAFMLSIALHEWTTSRSAHEAGMMGE